MSILKYWVWISSFAGIDAKTGAKLIDYFGSPEKVFFAEEKEYADIGLKAAEIRALSEKSLVRARDALAKCEENGYRVVTMTDRKSVV